MSGGGDRYYGQVKWFRDHKGYGFIMVMGKLDGEMDGAVQPGRELFVHHSDVHPAMSTYKTLVKGEYVSFMLKYVSRARGHHNAPPCAMSEGDVEIQACDVRGAYGGALMCDGLNVSSLNRTVEHTVPTVLHNGDIMFSPGDDVIL